MTNKPQPQPQSQPKPASTFADELKGAAPTVTITPTPLIMEKVGEKFRGLYLGQRTFQRIDSKTGEIKVNNVAHFYDGNGVLFNMGAMLTRAMEIVPVGVSVEIALTELKSNSKGGKTKIYSVTPLDVPVKDLTAMFGGLLNIQPPAAEHLLPAPNDSTAPVNVINQADADALWGKPE